MDDSDYSEQKAEIYKRNKQWSKPGWKITTFKSDKQEAEFQKWVQDNNIPFKDEAQPDYDMRGFYKALKAGDPKATSGINPSDNQLHFTDYFKTPYHESFSSESQWATKHAPNWIGDDQNGWKLMDRLGNTIKDETIKQGQQ